MYDVGKVLVTEEVVSKAFVCDLNRCKGACCVEGDLGAPLEESELEELKEAYPHVAPYLSEEGRKTIEEEQGLYVVDFEDDYSTPTIGDKECAYAIYDENKVLKCAIEQAYFDGKSKFRKPISCHLYPVRVQKLSDGYEALNYHHWSICKDACTLGEQLQVPIYKFVKDPLIRKYGEEWYKDLELQIKEEDDFEKNK